MRDISNLPGIIGILGRELAAVEERAARACLAWHEAKLPRDLTALRLATGQRSQVEARLRKNLAALGSSSEAGSRQAERLERSIRWEARDSYLRGMGLLPESDRAGVAPRLAVAG